MINKKYMNYIKKELTKDNELFIKYKPTEEEKEYLKKYNIKYEMAWLKRKCFLSDGYYYVEYCHYYIEK